MGNRFPNGSRRATINDVAAAAGVSKTTVSKFLSREPYYVADATKARIEAAIRELDFQPNAMARGLSNRRSYTVGVIVASVLNPFYPELIAGIEEVIEPAGYTLLLGSTNGEASRETKIVRSMVQRQVDGVIMASVRMRDREVQKLTASGLQVVLASRHLARAPLDMVVIDNRLGAQLATRHLLEHGHRRIAHIAGPQDILPFRERMQGYCDALAEAGVAFDDTLVVATGSDAPAGAAAIEQLMGADPAPSAVFVANDNMAIGVLEICQRKGWSVPDRLAVVGFDNIWIGNITSPRLTTVDSKARHVGRTAAHLLQQRIEHAALAESAGHEAPHELVVLQPVLVARRSCGCDEDDDADPSFWLDRKPVPYRGPM